MEDGDVIPVSETLPDVNLDEILASLDTDTRDYLTILVGAGAEGLRGNGPELARAIRRFEPTARYGRKVFGALAKRKRNIRRVDPQPVAGHGRARRQGRPARRVRRELERGVRDARAPGREPALDADRAAVRARRDPARARQGQAAGRRARPDAAGAAARRARARPDAARRCGRSCARRRRSSATRSARSCARRARRSTSCGPAMRDLAAATPDLTTHVHGRQLPARRARLQPAGRGGGLPVLGRLGQPPRQSDLHARRTRTARSAAACSSPPARTSRCSTRSPRPTRCSAR